MRRNALILVPLGIVVVIALWLVLDADGWGNAVAWVMERQRQFHRAMAGQLHGLADGKTAAAWGLVVLSFLYGVFHAAGPGHGKAVIATYLATSESRVGPGLVLAAGAALCQGLVAVVVVYGLVFLAGWLPGVESGQAATWAERTGYALLCLIGGLFAIRAAKGLIRLYRPVRQGGGQHHGHDHCRHGIHGCGCGHAPSPEQVAQAAGGWRNAMIVLLAVGLRPCSGAILVLALANLLGLQWAGVGAVAAMSAGTAITVSVLALLALKARRWAMALSGKGGLAMATLRGWGALIGGIAILTMGGSLLLASFGPAHPLRL